MTDENAEPHRTTEPRRATGSARTGPRRAAGSRTAPAPLPRAVPVQRRGDRGLPFVGQLLEYAEDPVALFRRSWERYGPVVPFRARGRNSVILLGPDACGEALLNKDKAFANGPRAGGQGDHAPAAAPPRLDRRPRLRPPIDHHSLPFPEDGLPIALARR
ncbi:cytochrome P450 [Streptomyces sp. NPDC002644]